MVGAKADTEWIAGHNLESATGAFLLPPRSLTSSQSPPKKVPFRPFFVAGPRFLPQNPRHRLGRVMGSGGSTLDVRKRIDELEKHCAGKKIGQA